MALEFAVGLRGEFVLDCGGAGDGGKAVARDVPPPPLLPPPPA